MNMIKIPSMDKKEYDELIKQNFIGRIAFKGENYPYITPFMYVFDGEFLYFLSTKYGKKIGEIKRDPNVAVEIEKYTEDMSDYKFTTLQGRIIEVENDDDKNKIKKMFIKMIKDRNLSNKALAALGHSPDESIQLILEEDRTMVWKLVDLKQIVALKNP
ncbi:pyridoxamine 5'-phosphate oxidase family protein [Methanobacterium sp.]|uniref:pyridoxamine 5'-phosphate oxidase family protein n=1 Tax=Methanobacterium sp. TaxID=2164 RepID=UPI003C78ED3B